MFKIGFHPFHMVSLSPWPLVGSLSLMSMVLNLFHYINSSGNNFYLIISLFSSVCVWIQWWRDVIRESTFQGSHTLEVCKGLYYGVIFFITSEVMFFFSFFFGYFFTSLSPDIEIGMMWPPVGVQSMSCFEVPLLNTLILLSSGVSITWMHHSLLQSGKSSSEISGFITIALGAIFSYFQFIEYYEMSFSMADSSYGSFFFIMTGFHGIHVMIGVIFISVSLFRLKLFHFSKNHHLGFEAAAWYWHFVDVVWLFLFVLVYWWGG